MLHGSELMEAPEHDDGTGLSVVLGPSTEAGAEPGGIGEGYFGMGFFCFSVLPSSSVAMASSEACSSGSKTSSSGLHEVDFKDDPVAIEVGMSDAVVEIVVEPTEDLPPSHKRRFAKLSMSRG